MSVAITITNAGRAALVNAANTGTAAVVIAAVGLSAIAVTPDRTATSLPNELKRVATVGGQMVADDIIHVAMTDASGDAYSARSFGIYLADGTLFAIYGQADPILTKTAASQGLLAIDVQLADASAANITFGPTNWLNPPATTETAGVVELATTDEAKAGTDLSRALTAAAAKAAVLNWVGYTPVQQGGGIGQLTNKLYMGWSGTRLKGTVDNFDLGNILTDDWAKGGVLPFNGTTMRRNGYDLYGPDNDGAGSPVDAGLFAGQLPSWYTDIIARLQYTPANRAGDTFSGPIRRDNGFYFDLSGGVTPLINFDDQDYMFYDRVNNVLKVVIGNVVRMNMPLHGNLDLYSETGGAFINGHVLYSTENDGAGSPVDAGLFWGQLPSYYTDIPSRLGYTPANRAGDTFTGYSVFRGGIGLGADGGPRITPNGNRLSFFNDGTNNERMAISESSASVQISGARSIGGSDIQGSGSLRVMPSGGGGVCISTYDTQDHTAVQFMRQVNTSQVQIGNIWVTDFSVSLNSASDHRLKTDLRPVTNASAEIMAIKIWDYEWISSGRRSLGVLAHELTAVEPDAVRGEKDAEEDYGTATPPEGLQAADGSLVQPVTDIIESAAPDGWTWTKVGTRPVYQSVDFVKLMPRMIACEQETMTRVSSLEEIVADLQRQIAALTFSPSA